MTEENTSVTTDGAKRCKACRRDQARKRKEREAAEADSVMDARFVEPVEATQFDFELPLGTLGRRWVSDGQCVREQMDPAWFFNALLEEETAAYCEGCQVINLCFAFSVIGGEQGVWGGTTERQRGLLSLAQRLTIRQSYGKMYAEYLGEKAPPGEQREQVSAPMPYIAEMREDTILRGMEAAEYETVAGQAGFDKTRFGNRQQREAERGLQS